MPSNLVQGAYQTVTLNTSSLAQGLGGISPTIDLTATIPYEVSFYISLQTASAPAVNSPRGCSIYLQYSPDGTNWTTFDPADINGLTDMQYIGFVPLQNGNPSRKFLSTAGAPINRYIRIVTFNDSTVSLSAVSGTVQWSPITGS